MRPSTLIVSRERRSCQYLTRTEMPAALIEGGWRSEQAAYLPGTKPGEAVLLLGLYSLLPVPHLLGAPCPSPASAAFFYLSSSFVLSLPGSIPNSYSPPLINNDL